MERDRALQPKMQKGGQNTSESSHYLVVARRDHLVTLSRLQRLDSLRFGRGLAWIHGFSCGFDCMWKEFGEQAVKIASHQILFQWNECMSCDRPSSSPII